MMCIGQQGKQGDGRSGEVVQEGEEAGWYKGVEMRRGV